MIDQLIHNSRDKILDNDGTLPPVDGRYLQKTINAWVYEFDHNGATPQQVAEWYNKPFASVKYQYDKFRGIKRKRHVKKDPAANVPKEVWQSPEERWKDLELKANSLLEQIEQIRLEQTTIYDSIIAEKERFLVEAAKRDELLAQMNCAIK